MSSTISLQEFQQLQEQFIQIKTEKYELQQVEKRLSTENQTLKTNYNNLKKEFIQLQNIVKQNKDKSQLIMDLNQMKKNAEAQQVEWKEKETALRSNMQVLFERNKELEEKCNRFQELLSADDATSKLEQELSLSKQQIQELETKCKSASQDQEHMISKVLSLEQTRAQIMKENEDLQNQCRNYNHLQAKLKEVTESRDKFNRDALELSKRVTLLEPLAERCKKLETTVRSMEEESNKNRVENIELKETLENVKRELSEKEERNKFLQSNATQWKEQINSLNMQVDVLNKEKENIIQRAKEYVRQMDEKDTTQMKELKQKEQKLIQLEHEVETLTTTMISLHVCQYLSNVNVKICNQQIKSLEQQLLKEETWQNKAKELMVENEQLNNTMKEQKTEYHIALKKSNTMIQEYKAQIQQVTRKLESQHSPVQQPQQTFPIQQLQQPQVMQDTVLIDKMQQENVILIQKISEQQAKLWKLEENLQYTKDQFVKAKEEIQRKSEIISHYIGKNEQQHPSSPMSSNQNSGNWFGFTKQIFSTKNKEHTPPKSISLEVYQRMQQAMEESLLRNIQLESDLKVMAQELQKMSVELADARKLQGRGQVF